MTKQEYEAWLAETKKSEGNWVRDITTAINKRGELFYKGGEAGQYVRISPDGLLTIGEYAGAFPHIGDAAFSAPIASRKFETNLEALNAALRAVGKELLLAIIGI